MATIYESEGGHHVSARIHSRYDPSSRDVYWWKEGTATYVLVRNTTRGPWNHKGVRVDLVSIHGSGEVRWSSDYGRDNDGSAAAAKHFGLTPWPRAESNPGRGRAPNLKGLRTYLLGLKSKAFRGGIMGWDTILDRTREAIFRYGAAALLKVQIRETESLARRYEGYKMHVVTALGPANVALHKIERALGIGRAARRRHARRRLV